MNFDQLITSLRELDGSLKGHVARTASVGLTLRNWLVGAYIVEFEQNGEERAEYGKNLIREVSKAVGVRGLNPTNLELCRRLFHENHFVSAYKVALPKPEELAAFLLRESRISGQGSGRQIRFDCYDVL